MPIKTDMIIEIFGTELIDLILSSMREYKKL